LLKNAAVIANTKKLIEGGGELSDETSMAKISRMNVNMNTDIDGHRHGRGHHTDMETDTTWTSTDIIPKTMGTYTIQILKIKKVLFR
jgi:hypothetical protein